MRKPLLALTACVAAVFAAAPAMAASAPLSATLTDECGFVRVEYPAGATGSFTVKRDGVDVLTHSPLSSGGNFAVFAQAGETVSLTGSVEGSHAHATTPGCTEPDVSVVSFEDRCQDSSAVKLRNDGAAATGFRFVAGSTVTEIASVPPGESTHIIGGLAEYGTFSVSWANPADKLGTVTTHVYATPGDCGASKLPFSFTDKCDKLEWTVSNGAAGAQKVELLKGSDVVFAQWVPVGGPHTYAIPAVDGAAFQARYFGGAAMGDAHTYRTPANCAAGGLPVTGSSPQSVALLGVSLVIAGLGALVFAQSRRRTGEAA